jgi:hypothetical protein
VHAAQTAFQFCQRVSFDSANFGVPNPHDFGDFTVAESPAPREKTDASTVDSLTPSPGFSLWHACAQLGRGPKKWQESGKKTRAEQSSPLKKAS